MKAQEKTTEELFDELSELQRTNDSMKLLHELEVHRSELEMQNEELMRARDDAEQVSVHYTALYDHAPAGYVSLSADGIIQKLNHACARILGKDSSQLESCHFAFFVSDDTKPLFDMFLQRVFMTGANESCDLVMIPGGRGTVDVHIEGILSGNGTECLATLVDVTSQKQSAGLLEKSNRQKGLILEAAGEGILGIGMDGRPTFVNPMAVGLLGYQAEEMLLKEAHGLFHHHHPDGTVFPIADCPICNTLHTGIAVSGEAHFWHKGGKCIPFEFSCFTDFGRRESHRGCCHVPRYFGPQGCRRSTACE
jgi:PAS domain S-box-containing protein